MYLSLVYEEASGLDLKNFGKILQDLNSKHFEDKKHKFSQNLEDVFKIEDVNYKEMMSLKLKMLTIKSFVLFVEMG